MQVLVTGATGFTGGHLARWLTARGHRVRALVRDPERARRSDLTDVEFVPGDLRDERSVTDALAGVEVAFNIAALYRQAGLPADTYRAVNATAVAALVRAA